MTTQTQSKIEDLQQQLTQAQKRDGELALEARELPGKVQEAGLRAARQKAQAARAGGQGDQLLGVAADLDLDELQKREQALPLERWAAGLAVTEIARDLHAAKSEEAEASASALVPALKLAESEAAEAERRVNDIRARHSSLVNTAQLYAHDVKKADRKIAELENGAPVA